MIDTSIKNLRWQTCQLKWFMVIHKKAREYVAWWTQYHGTLTCGVTLFPAWISNPMPCKVWNEIIYPGASPNFNGTTVEVWKWVSNFTPYFTMDVSTYPYNNVLGLMFYNVIISLDQISGTPHVKRYSGGRTWLHEVDSAEDGPEGGTDTLWLSFLQYSVWQGHR